jgi:hypothetical protein
MATNIAAPFIEQAESIARSLIHLACKIPPAETMSDEEKAKLHTTVSEQSAILTRELDTFFEQVNASLKIQPIRRVLEGPVPPPDC